MEEELKQILQSHTPQQTEIETKSKSPLVNQYQQFFSQIAKAKITERQYCQVLAQGSIYSTKQNNENKNQIELQIITHTQKFEIVRLKFQINFLIFELNVLNLQTISQNHNLIDISSTSASIFVDNQLIPDTVVKCLPIREDNFMKSFLQAVKEYCLFKYASLMRIGPKLSNIFGFDLIISQKCIQFCMERCTPVLSISQGQARQLKQKMLKLHELQVVHLDIKPSNISYSPSLKQLVFIDFGLSDAINQKLGYETKSCFVGSLSYCSPQMLKCYQSGSYLFVDLFYNDVHALDKTIRQLKANHKQENATQESLGKIEHAKANKFMDFLLQISVKFKIYTGSSQIFKNAQICQYLHNNKQKIIHFCSKLVHSKIIEQIYYFFDPKYSHCQFTLINYSPHYLQNKQKQPQSVKQSKWYDYFQSFKHGMLLKRSFKNLGEYFAQDLSLKQIVLNEKVISVLKKCDYYQKYVFYTDFQSSLSTFDKRVQASRLLSQYSKLTAVQQGCFQLIIQCQVHVLDYLIECYQQIHINCYPILLYNLIVMEALSDQELVQYYQKIAFLQIKDCKMRAFLLFKCRIIVRMLKFMINTRYSIRLCDQGFQNIFCSKILQIFNSSQFIKDKAFAFILYQINRCYEYSKMNKDSFRQYENLLTHRQQFLQSEIFSEVKIYYILSMILAHQDHQAYLQKINNLKKIADIEANRIRKCVKFQIYHYSLYQQYYSIKNLQVNSNLFKCLEKCLGHNELINKFIITNYEITLNWRQKYNSNLTFYNNFLSFLENNPKIDLKTLLSKLDFITKYYTTLYSTMNPQVFILLQRIFQNLRKRFTLNILDNFIEYYFNEFSRNDNFFNDAITIAVLLGKLYKSDPRLKQKINTLLSIIENKLGQIQNRIGGFRCIFVIKTYFYKQNGQYQQLIESIKGYLKVCNQHYQKLACLLQANYYCINHKAISHNQDECLLLLYNFITQADLWHILLSVNKSQTYLNFIHLYLLKRQMYQQLFSFHLKLIDYIKAYPIHDNICNYSRSLVKLFRLQGDIKGYVIAHSRQLQKFTQNKYSALFYAVLLLQFDTSRYQSQKIISILRRSLTSIVFISRAFVLGHLHHFILRKQVNKYRLLFQKTGISDVKRMQFLMRHYYRNSISQFDFSKFKNVFVNNFIKKKHYAKSQKTKMLLNTVRKYHDHIESKQKILNQYYCYYRSPLH